MPQGNGGRGSTMRTQLGIAAKDKTNLPAQWDLQICLSSEIASRLNQSLSTGYSQWGWKGSKNSITR